MGKMISQFPALPHRPGIYFFWRGKTLLYIGKATDLHARLVSHWRARPGEKSHALLNEATRLTFEESRSAIDALLGEAQLIRRHHPKYNILMRDDKNYFYVGITKEKFPRIFITHQPQIAQSARLPDGQVKRPLRSPRFRVGAGERSAAEGEPRQRREASKAQKYIGPFTSGRDLKITLRLLRRIFPYCICKNMHPRACQSSQLGLCPGYCCSLKLQVSSFKFKATNFKFQVEYNKNIKNIIAVLSGKKSRLLPRLKREMREASRRQNYEKAGKLRDQIAGIENIFGHRSFLMPSHGQPVINAAAWERVEKNLRVFLKTRRNIRRAEGYDISNISGREAGGSMVVFIDGVPAKSEYRKFRIKTVSGPNDADMLKEVLKRRIIHKEWGLPDLMLIDGGKGQLNAAVRILAEFGGLTSKVSIAALAKREEELYLPNRSEPLRLSKLPPDTAHFLQRVRDESHRFARAYHHKLREISYRR